MRIMVVDDEPRLAEGLRAGLVADGFAVDVARTGTDGLWLAREEPFDAIVLDVMLPGLNGYRVCQLLRAERIWTPILMLTAKDGEWDEVEGLDAGADDYLTKPFSHAVLVARLRALLRRGARERPAVLCAGDLRLDPASRRAWRGDAELALTSRELSLLEFLLRRRGEVLSKREILAHVWDFDFDGDPTSSRSTCGICGTSWTGRSGAPRSRRCGAPATGWPPMAAKAHRRFVRPMRGSVRVRTTSGSVAVVGVALLGAVALIASLHMVLVREVRATASLRATEAAGFLAAGGDPTAAVAGDDDIVLQLLDPSGEVVGATPNAAGRTALARLAPGESREMDVPFDDDSFLVVSAPAGGDRTVLLGQSLDAVAGSMRALAALLAVGLPALLFVVGATTWRVVGRALAPVEEIRAEVDAISTTQLQRRVPRPAGSDEIGRLAGTMNRMLDRLERARARERRFVADASHELRSPISAIRQHAEVALEHPELSEQLARTAHAESLRMQALVDDLLLLAQADEDALPLRRRPVDLDDLVLAEARRLRDLAVTVDTTRVSAARVNGDPAALRRVLRNLGDNAARHARGRVGLALAARDGWAELYVEDDGPGVAVSDRAGCSSGSSGSTTPARVPAAAAAWGSRSWRRSSSCTEAQWSSMTARSMARG